MKSMKKILSAILTVALLASFFVMPVYAVSQDAQTCAAIDVLRGDGSGVTDTYLAKNTNRSQGAKILLRLMGREVEADAYSGTATFTDASDATAYWQPMLAYLKANPTVGFQGYPDGTFAPNKIMTAQEIYKVLLVSLGYVENVDFTWGSVFSFAAGIGLTQLSGVAEITNDNLATALVEALKANKKDGTKLISFLIDKGVVSLIAAQNAGLVPKTLTIMDAFASGSKEITATLNMAAPAGTTVTLKRGSVTWPADITWESGNKVVKFSRSFKFTPGDYTITVGASTFAVTVEAEKLIGISIGADHIYPKAGQDLMISFSNQYGDPMNIPASAYVVVLFPRLGLSLTTANTGSKIIVDASTITNVKSDDSVMITIYEATLSQTKTIPVYSEPVIKSLHVSGLEIANKAPKINENTAAHRLVLEVTDQYGNPYKMTTADLSTFGGPVQLTSSNELSIPSSSFTIDTNGKLMFNALAAGNARITFIVPTQAIVRYYDLVVSEPSTVHSMIINTGSGMITSGTRHNFTTFAYDQLGASIPLLGNFDYSKFTMSTTNLNVVPQNAILYDSTTGILSLLPGTPGTATVTYYYNGIYQGTLLVTVYDAPKPQYIAAINFPNYFEVGANKMITLGNVVVRDQYGQIFKMEGSAYTIDLQITSGTTVTTSGNVISAALKPTLIAGTTVGTTTITLAVKHNTTGIVASSQSNISITVKATADITSFMFENVGTMYAGGASGTAYYKKLKINGKIGSKEVVLKGGPKPDSITLVTSSNSDFNLNQTTLNLYATKKGSTLVQAYVQGNPVASLTVTASDVAPKVTTMTFNPTSKTLAQNATFNIGTILTILDQYGVDITSTANVYYSSNNSAIASVDQTGLVTTYTTAGTVNISVVELTGAGSTVLSLTVQ